MIWWVIGGAVLFILFMSGSAMASESTSGATGVPKSTFADAIAHAEGFYRSGSRPSRNHNPGDLEHWPGVSTDSEGYSVFATNQDGWNALEQQLDDIRNGTSRYYSTSMSIKDMGITYAGGDPGGDWARNVSAFLGANVGDSIGDYL